MHTTQHSKKHSRISRYVGVRRLAVAFAVAALAAVPAVAGATATNKDGSSLAVVRQVTAKYHDVGVALADGYVPGSPCTESPDGVMGIHYINPALLGQPVDLRRPAILLYVPGDDGPELIGVEYFHADADQDLGTDDDRPSLLGQEFDGPMPGHGGGMPIHFDLHVWAWANNPSGMFAEFNPRLSC